MNILQNKREGELALGRARSARYRKAHPEKIKKAAKTWQQENLDKFRKYNDRFRKKNPDYNINYYKEHNEGIKKQANEYRKMPSGRMHVLLSSIRVRALKRGLNFESALFGLFISNPPTHCFCCGCSLDYSIGRGRNNRHGSPSFDRVDNSKGYAVSNVRVICMRCNNKKSDLTLLEVEALFNYMKGVLHE